MTLALAFATIERPSVVQRLIRSVRSRFPDLPIHVADQSRHVEPMLSFYEAHGVHLVRMPFDAGVTASRNRLVETIDEEFFILCDDDFIFGPETAFDDPLAVLQADPELAVVGGRLRDTTGSEYTRHWEMYLQYDPANRLLTAIPIYRFSPQPRQIANIDYYLCDTVVNFAVFRRSIFSKKIRWDERFKSNGEHEDFYLNLKMHGKWRVGYAPGMIAEHHHPDQYHNYQSKLRDRGEGWRLFMEKWSIDQYLELDLGLRSKHDPGAIFDPLAMLDRYRLPVVSSAGRASPPQPLPPSPSEEALRRLRLFFRYDPILRSDSDFVLWHRAELDPQASGDVTRLAISLRWFAADGRCLLWRTEPVVIDLGGEYWQPLPVQVPRSPAAEWLRFEVVALSAAGPVPTAVGFIFPTCGEPAGTGQPRALPDDVLALSRIQNFAAELPDPARLQGLIAVPDRSGQAASVDCRGSDASPVLLLPTDQVPEISGLLFMHWEAAFGTALAGVRLPMPSSGAPTIIALPEAAPLTNARIIALEATGGASMALRLAHPFVTALPPRDHDDADGPTCQSS